MVSPPAPYHLRRMRSADVTAVYDIYARSFPTAARPGLFEHEVRQNEIAYYQVLEAASELIGFAGVWLIADEVHLVTLAVDPRWRTRHLGELLLLNALFVACTLPASIVTLEVRRSNGAAQNLYRKYRFELVGERPRYYRDTGEDALLMTVPALDASYRQFLEVRQRDLFERMRNEGSRPLPCITE